MNICGEKIILRAIEPKDSSMLYNLINDEETEYMLGGWSFPVSERKNDEWINCQEGKENILRCIIDVQGAGVGIVMLTDIDYKNGNAEVHIKMALDNARGKGYGTDAILTIVSYAFSELRLKCIHSRVSKHNIISQRLFKKCLFNEEGIMQCRLFKKGEYIDVISFSKINENL